MPRWHDATKDWVRDGRLAVVGVAQEQHAGRCALFAQWRGIPWPIAHDPINGLGLRGVPVAVGIDEYGIVRVLRPKPETLENDLLDKTFPPPDGTVPLAPVAVPDLGGLARTARKENAVSGWRDLGDALVLWADTSRADEAVDAYTRALQLAPDDGAALFRLGVAHRARFDSGQRRGDDFQTAAECWGQAAALDPGQYIWRRRIEQYGPRLTKPYPFYDWVDEARAAIRARGERPAALVAMPVGSEIAQPSREFGAASEADVCPDPDGRVPSDAERKVTIASAVVPARVAPGGAVSVHVTLTLDPSRKLHWEDAAGPLKLWVQAPERWEMSHRLLIQKPVAPADSKAARHLSFEVKAPATARGKAALTGFALYGVCDDEDGTCSFLRQDVRVSVRIGEPHKGKR